MKQESLRVRDGLCLRTRSSGIIRITIRPSHVCSRSGRVVYFLPNGGVRMEKKQYLTELNTRTNICGDKVFYIHNTKNFLNSF